MKVSPQLHALFGVGLEHRCRIEPFGIFPGRPTALPDHPHWYKMVFDFEVDRSQAKLFIEKWLKDTYGAESIDFNDSSYRYGKVCAEFYSEEEWKREPKTEDRE